MPHRYRRTLRGLLASALAFALMLLGIVPTMALASSPTSVSGVSASVSPTTAGALAQYQVGFTATSGLSPCRERRPALVPSSRGLGCRERLAVKEKAVMPAWVGLREAGGGLASRVRTPGAGEEQTARHRAG